MNAHARRPLDVPAELRLADLATFLAVHRCGSITGAARELHVTPSQVSKAVARLEKELGVTLLSRSVRGALVSDAALRILPDLQQVMASVRRMYRGEHAPQRVLTIAAPSYLCASFLPVIAQAQPHLFVRGLEMPPAMLRAHAAENFFDLGLIGGTVRLPPTWQSASVGDLRKALLMRPSLAERMGPLPVAQKRVAEVPLITPVYNLNGQYVPVDDDCPLDQSQRRVGHEAQTIGVALELAMVCDQAVFGPAIAARRHIEAGWLVEVPVEGWNVSEPLHFAWNADRLRATEQRAILAALTATMASIAAPTGKRSLPTEAAPKRPGARYRR